MLYPCRHGPVSALPLPEAEAIPPTCGTRRTESRRSPCGCVLRISDIVSEVVRRGSE